MWSALVWFCAATQFVSSLNSDSGVLAACAGWQSANNRAAVMVTAVLINRLIFMVSELVGTALAKSLSSLLKF